MTLICKPCGRGNWRATEIRIQANRLGGLDVRPGVTFTLGGVLWRVCQVLA